MTPEARDTQRPGQNALAGPQGDGEPSMAVLWKGFQHLVDVAAMYRIMRPAPTPRPRASQNKDSG